MQQKKGMLKEVHRHIIQEIQQSSRTDTIFMITAVIFNLIVLGINWGVASENNNGTYPPENDWILSLLIVGTLVINTFAVRALLTGLKTRSRLLTGLIQMYKDNDVEKYYDEDLLTTYGARYWMLVAVISILAVIAIVIPLMERILG